MCSNRGTILRGQIYTRQQKENTGHNQGSNAECHICEVRFLRPEEVSNKVRSWEDLEQERIWPVIWVRTSSSGLSHESCRSDRTHCYMVPVAKDRVGSDSFKQLFRKGQHHLLNRIFLAFPSSCSVSLLTLNPLLIPFSTHDALLLGFFYQGLSYQSREILFCCLSIHLQNSK